MAFRDRCEDVQPVWQTSGTVRGGRTDQERGRAQNDHQSNHGNDQLMVVESDSDISIELDDYLAGMNLGELLAISLAVTLSLTH